jgi:hypothetical protein
MRSGRGIRHGVAILSAMAAGALGTQVAAAATPTMTELQAERFVARAVKYTDPEAQAEYKADFAYVLDQYRQACVNADQTVIANRQRCSIAKSNLNNARDQGCGCVYRPTQIDCRGASTSRDAYHFTRIRCKAFFVNANDIAGWGRGFVKPLGSNRASWTWAS